MYCCRHHNPGKEVIVSETMSLTQFVERYAKDLPLQIKVLRGYCGNTARLTSKYMHTVLIVHMYMYSRRHKNGDVSVPYMYIQ